MHAKVYKKKRGCFMNCHDVLLLVLAVAIQAIIMHYTVVHQLIRGEDHDIDF